ncbi:glycosyltransferase [Mycolicibacterium tokaiense]|uniref:Glycosyltransferase, group I n=1 Tax=Mycolicibacterium tokaiense TaxID=39695 RepID=A0A378TNS8_9MYCO|nr:glycosyltransferase [Mycolicibacterium tokaiense]BBY89170.1 glycosyl transferase [Mycolicibacterium tokaiense]STZ62442.1 glycosyltransferase, group I [Mycolicibacterium tokaiense]
MTVGAPAPKFDHLLRLTDDRGTFEHACGDQPRREHGYCVDDVARVLVVTTREPDPTADVNRMAGIALRFLGDAQQLGGPCRNRMDIRGDWVDQPSTDDCWGRCVWALGTAAARSSVKWVRTSALIQFDRAVQVRGSSPRARAFAVLGAAEVLAVDAEHRRARDLITNYAATLPEPGHDPDWPWPEPRLAYANAVLAEAMIAAGVALEASRLRQRGLELLAWLLGVEMPDGRLSPTPVGGRGPGQTGPAFDQQAIEVSSIADACARAARVDPAPGWPAAVQAAAAWFQGVNDVGEPMWDPATGGGYDGLHADRVNRNQGAESTLAVLSTLQHAQRFSELAQ